jgi:signal transduction histidine kinase
MFSKLPKHLHTTAAWRISLWATLAFALGTAVAFAIVYLLVAQGIRERIDTWLSGEAAVLAHVSAGTSNDHLHQQMVGEVAELATEEVPDERNARGESLSSVFFLVTDPSSSDGPLWVGPGSKDPFVRAIQRSNVVPGAPKSISVEGWQQEFRVVGHAQNGRVVYLGLSDHGTKHTLHRMARRFLVLWSAMLLLGFAISYASARRTLIRVERITETVARIGTEELEERLPEPVNADEISRLAKTFNHMLDRLQSSVNQLRTVTGGIAHDLKSPVTLIRGTLESALCHEGNENWRDSVGEAIEDLDKLLQLLNTTLDLAEAEAGALRMDRSPVDLSEVVSQLIEIYRPAIVEHEHELTSDIEENVVVDADLPLLNRVVSNLLENELTHLPAGCKVSIRLRSQQGSAELVIQDNGPGFPPDMGGRAFERFVKGKHSPGHGLGLAFVDAVVQAHGGAARISDGPGGGALITLSLPVSVLQAA